MKYPEKKYPKRKLGRKEIIWLTTLTHCSSVMKWGQKLGDRYWCRGSWGELFTGLLGPLFSFHGHQLTNGLVPPPLTPHHWYRKCLQAYLQPDVMEAFFNWGFLPDDCHLYQVSVQAPSALNFPLRTVFIVSNGFEYILIFFHEISAFNFLIYSLLTSFFLYSVVSQFPWVWMLFLVSVDIDIQLKPWWSDRRITGYYFSLLESVALCPNCG